MRESHKGSVKEKDKETDAVKESTKNVDVEKDFLRSPLYLLYHACRFLAT